MSMALDEQDAQRMLPGLSEQDANAALAWLESHEIGSEGNEELDDEILAFERSLNADWEVRLYIYFICTNYFANLTLQI